MKKGLKRSSCVLHESVKKVSVRLRQLKLTVRVDLIHLGTESCSH